VRPLQFRYFDECLNKRLYVLCCAAFPSWPPGRASFTLDLPMDRQAIERISKALADETRLRIFEAISARGRMNCGEIVSLRGVTPATVSHHLRILADAELIECRREGQFVYSKAKPGIIRRFAKALTALSCKRKK